MKKRYLMVVAALLISQGCAIPITEYSGSYDIKEALLQTSDRPESELLIAVRKDPSLLKLIKNPSENIQLEALNSNRSYRASCGLIKYLKSPSLAVQLAAVRVRACPDAISYIKNPKETVKVAAAKRNMEAISYINNPSEAVKIASAKSSPWAILNIKSPSKAVLAASEAVRIQAMKQRIANPPYPGSYQLHPVISLFTLGDFRHKGTWQEDSEAIQLLVVEKYPKLIKMMKNPHLSVKNHPKVVAYKKKTYSTARLAAESDNPEKILLEAIKKDPSYIRNIANPSENIQLEALKRDPDVMMYIKNPTKKVIQFMQ